MNSSSGHIDRNLRGFRLPGQSVAGDADLRRGPARGQDRSMFLSVQLHFPEIVLFKEIRDHHYDQSIYHSQELL